MSNILMMSEQFKLGETFFDEEQNELELIFNDTKKVVLCCTENLNNSIIVKAEYFFEMLENKTIYPIYLHNAHIEELSFKQKEKLARRKPYIQILEKLVEEGLKATTKSTYKRLTSMVEEEFGIYKHPSKSYIALWWKLYQESDCIIEDTIPPDTKVPTRLNEPTEAVLSAFLQKVWLKSKTSNVSSAFALYEEKAIELGKTNPAIKKVSIKTFKKRLSELTELELILSSGSRAKIAQTFRTLCKKIITTSALERVEMDGLSLNLALINEQTGEISGNVSLYIAIDCHTRYPVSVTFELGEKESTDSVVHLTKNMFISMSDELNASGLPILLVVDNGPGFKSFKMKSLAERLRIDYINTPSNMPWKKPFVESFNNTIRQEFFEGLVYTDKKGNDFIGLPGYLGKRTSQKSRQASDKTIKKSAALTVENFRELLTGWLIHYVNQPHKGLNGMTPQEAWDKACSDEPPVQFNYEKNTQVFHIHETKRIIEERGVIELDCQKFTSPKKTKALKFLYNELKLCAPDSDAEVTVKFDKEDARSITVIGEPKGMLTPIVIEVPNKDYGDFAKPISFAQLKANRTIVPRRALFKVSLDPIKQTTNSQKSGKRIPDAKKNISKYPNAEDRINANNQSLYPKDKVDKEFTTKMKKASKNDLAKLHGQGDFWEGEL